MSGLPGARTCPGPGEASDLKSPLSAKFREPLTETRFQQLFGDAEQEPELLAEPRWSRLWRRRASACSGPGAWRLLLARLPPLRWLPHYRWRAWLLGDAVAGLTVGIVHVPQGERPQQQPGRGPSSRGLRVGTGPGNRERSGWARVAAGSATGTQGRVLGKDSGAPSDPRPQLPSSVQSCAKSWPRSDSGNWRDLSA